MPARQRRLRSQRLAERQNQTASESSQKADAAEDRAEDVADNAELVSERVPGGEEVSAAEQPTFNST